MSISKMGVKKLLSVGFGVVLLLLIGIAISGYWGLNSVTTTAIVEFKGMLATDAAITEHSARARANVVGLRRYEKDIYLNIGAKDKEAEYLKKWTEQKENLIARISDLEKAATSQKGKDVVKSLKTELQAYEAGFQKVYELIRAGKITTSQEANTAIYQYKDPIHRLEEAAKGFSAEGAKRMKQIENVIKDEASRTTALISILSLISIVLGVVCAFLIGRSITGSLKRIIEGLQNGADQLASASGQVSSASQSLAGGASEQAASIEETSSSLEEMSSMTKQNADHANQADTLMKSANDVVNKANGSMGELTKSMEEITRASEETSKIIKTIDEIAFQTNLLALNAAVEAARAGEAGAGFAVVAGEVRNLAMRAADAAKNTANLIEGTVKKVKDGSQLVTRTNEAFSEVAKSASKVGELVAEIAAASNEQAQGIDQVNKAIAEMDKVVQTNASDAEESASASEEMNAQANQMKVFVRDLVSMIGGSSAGRVDSEGSAPRREKMTVKRTLDVPVEHRGKEVTQYRAKEVRPDRVIPLEDKDFKDF